MFIEVLVFQINLKFMKISFLEFKYVLNETRNSIFIEVWYYKIKLVVDIWDLAFLP